MSLLRAVGLRELAGGDGAAVEHEAGDVEAGERHDGGGHVFVAAGDADEAVEAVAAGDEFDGVGDDFARDERGLHAFGAHGDAVGDGDGVELHGRAAGFADALLDGFGDLAEMEVAGADLGPGVGDADDGLVQVFFGEADAAEVGAGGGAGGAFGEGDGVCLAGGSWSLPLRSFLRWVSEGSRDGLCHAGLCRLVVRVAEQALKSATS